MHFAMPSSARKHSHPQAYASSLASPRWSALILRRRRLQWVAVLIIGAFTFFMLFSRIFSSSPGRPPPGTPEVVLVTVIDDHGYSQEHIHQIKKNREDYARRHGYAIFLPAKADYSRHFQSIPGGWTCIPAMRNAMALFPHSQFFFFLGQNALIMNLDISLDSHITSRERLESLMLRDIPVVPPDSVIKTFAHQKGDEVDLILTQDQDGLAQRVFILRQGEWARFFLDTWLDPLFRSYNFQKAEAHALEHIVQWHPTILTKLALVPQRIMSSYNAVPSGQENDARFQDGDFIVRFPKCDSGRIGECEAIMKPWYSPQNVEEQ